MIRAAPLALFVLLVACAHEETSHERYLREKRERAEIRLEICREMSHSDPVLCEIDQAIAGIEEQRGRAVRGIRGRAAQWQITGLTIVRREHLEDRRIREARVRASARVKCPPDQVLC